MKSGTATARLTGTTAVLYVHYNDGARRMHTLEGVNEWRYVMPWLEHKLSEHKMQSEYWRRGSGRDTIERPVSIDNDQHAVRNTLSEQEKKLDRSLRKNCSVESAFDLDYCR